MLKMLDLFSGLGGASEAMVRSGNWEVLRIENNPLLSGVEHTEMIDVIEFRDELAKMIEEGYTPEPVDLLWASPPCVEFSLAYSSPQSIANRNNEPYEPCMDLLLATLDIIDMIQPRYWVIENVRGAKKWFKPHLGEQRQVINHAIFLWGNYPMIVVDSIESKYANDTSSKDPLRANKRAIIPFAISESLRRAVEEQTSIFQWLGVMGEPVDENGQ
tara:strand:+ start:1303 stop:1950 length:648 start_codon:yes stop_codon:yes gene_type:complete